MRRPGGSMLAESHRACGRIKAARFWEDMAAMADNPDADPVHDRVDQVIQDMTAGRVIPRKVDELSTAVERTKRDQAVHRVTQKA